jgi:hypothetical protein
MPNIDSTFNGRTDFIVVPYHHLPEVAYRATVDFFSKVMQTKSNVYEKLYATYEYLHRFEGFSGRSFMPYSRRDGDI